MNARDLNERRVEQEPWTAISDRMFWLMLIAIRRSKKLRVTAAAKLIGVKSPTLSEWESGRGGVSEDTLLRISKAYGFKTFKEFLLEGLRLIEDDARCNP